MHVYGTLGTFEGMLELSCCWKVENCASQEWQRIARAQVPPETLLWIDLSLCKDGCTISLCNGAVSASSVAHVFQAAPDAPAPKGRVLGDLLGSVPKDARHVLDRCACQ